jgi:hypothetical protein
LSAPHAPPHSPHHPLTTYLLMRRWNWVSTRWNLLVLLRPVLFLCAGYSTEFFHIGDQTQTN